MKYIKCIKDTKLLTAGKWYGIDKLNFYIGIITVFRPSDNDWVMSDKENFDMGFLSEHNPDLENETHPITKDNILDVLKHNGYNESTLEAYCELCIRNSTAYYGAVMLNNVPNWIGAVEAIVGKLKPLPKLEVIELKVGDSVEVAYIYSAVKVIKLFDYDKQKVHYEGGTFDYFKSMKCDYIKSVNGKSGIYKIPEFNFERYLLDNGFKKTTGVYDVIFSVSHHLSIYKSGSTPAGEWSCGGVVIQENLQNADILITMANLAKDLK